jgi:hypothetical protein
VIIPKAVSADTRTSRIDAPMLAVTATPDYRRELIRRKSVDKEDGG